jgi:hypothetical protein
VNTSKRYIIFFDRLDNFLHIFDFIFCIELSVFQYINASNLICLYCINSYRRIMTNLVESLYVFNPIIIMLIYENN